MSAVPISRDALLSRAGQLVPSLKERASKAEELRQMPQESVRDIVDSGLVRIGNPPRYGGYDDQGVTSDTIYEVAWELGRACGSSAWCYSVWAVHAWITGHFPEQAQEEFWSTGPDTLASSAFSPSGAKAVPVPGGLQVSGRWEFSSGSDAGQWAMLGVPADSRCWVLVPRSDYEIVDTWFTSGLRGTGSKDIIIGDAFVPSHRVLDVGRAGDADLTGWKLHGRLSYRLPLLVILGWDLAAPLIGMSQGAIDEFILRSSASGPRGRTAEAAATQIRLAEAAAEVDSARTIHLATIKEMLAKADRGEGFTPVERARHARNKAYVARLCVAAVNRLFDASGGHALFEAEPIQRFHRDVHAASHQITFNWDAAAVDYGRLALGLETTKS
jgi:alkylation response protein AidB-like acyl-CoA dehydrogenase